jgi:hypothetical protein
VVYCNNEETTFGTPRPETVKPYKLNETAFDSLTDEAAYWIGFLLADGCISISPGRHVVQLSQRKSDSHHLQKFLNFIGSPTRPIYLRKSTKFKNYKCQDTASVVVCSKVICDSLQKWGVHQRKSKIAEAPDCLVLNPHFWRGVVDGDGWVGVQRKGTLAVLGLCGGRYLCEQFKEFIKTIVPTGSNVIKNHSIFSIRIFARQAKLVLATLYPTDAIALSRKYKAACECLLL